MMTTTTKAKNYYNPNDLLHSHWSRCECVWESVWQSVVLFFSTVTLCRFRSFLSVDMCILSIFHFISVSFFASNRIDEWLNILISSCILRRRVFLFSLLLFPILFSLKSTNGRIRIYILGMLLRLQTASRSVPACISRVRGRRRRRTKNIITHINSVCGY